MLSKLLGAKAVAAVVLGTAAVGTAAAAATGSLPDAAQAKAHSIVAAVPDANEVAGHGAGAARADTPRASGAGDHPVLPGVAGLCQAYGAGSGGENDSRLDSTAFGRLADAAGGADKIAVYCRAVAARAAGSAAGASRHLAGACRSWQAADQAGRAPAAAVLDQLTTAAGDADAIAPYCTALLSKDNGGSADRPPAAPPATAHGNAPTAPPGEGHDQATPSHPAPPTPRG